MEFGLIKRRENELSHSKRKIETAPSKFLDAAA